MKYHQLKAFVTVADEGSIRAAARRLNVSPAALTKAVKELEHALGVSLVVRTARGVQLTGFGQQLQVRARLIVAEMQRARDDIEQAQGATTGSVAAAITPAAAVTILPDAFRAFRRRFPVARVSFIEGFPGVALPRLHDGSLDFAVAVVVPELLAAEFDHAELYASRSLIVARNGHPLASATSLAELVDADWLMNPSPESSTQALFNCFVAHGLPVPSRIVECPSFGLAHSLMTGSDLLASMPEQLLDADWARDRLVVLPIRDRLPAVSVQVVTRRDSPLTPAASMLLDCLRDSARRQGLR
ncbi:LysR family transcriptional regulator [Burkholderia ubonensis]|uniref:LysR family transcriptional regulator n=2 Tax=Burkholderia ubonensis TaxID=101571 RepID=A0A125DFT3_9BURK|nr:MULTISPECIES: LysR substrate-binding domain-containing protein [Burkholderia]AYZ62304.1 LysR family transcriptional regulator [Burkholderia multivorans]AOK26256.1 LysR family transcriptional regulator [Burkholderia ubonensis]KIP13812.1 bacterial regulatory helix-turn-helix, lysR family protein [Burkholderia sp. MSHR3999]KUZ92959.1 LysR family transcriptional regulator [Burkholderia ubonensis]KVA75712.1 LysR family transcriptional regulator [Burkholderia ubonensis]